MTLLKETIYQLKESDYIQGKENISLGLVWSGLNYVEEKKMNYIDILS